MMEKFMMILNSNQWTFSQSWCRRMGKKSLHQRARDRACFYCSQVVAREVLLSPSQGSNFLSSSCSLFIYSFFCDTSLFPFWSADVYFVRHFSWRKSACCEPDKFSLMISMGLTWSSWVDHADEKSGYCTSYDIASRGSCEVASISPSWGLIKMVDTLHFNIWEPYLWLWHCWKLHAI